MSHTVSNPKPPSVAAAPPPVSGAGKQAGSPSPVAIPPNMTPLDAGQRKYVDDLVNQEQQKVGAETARADQTERNYRNLAKRYKNTVLEARTYLQSEWELKNPDACALFKDKQQIATLSDEQAIATAKHLKERAEQRQSSGSSGSGEKAEGSGWGSSLVNLACTLGPYIFMYYMMQNMFSGDMFSGKMFNPSGSMVPPNITGDFAALGLSA